MAERVPPLHDNEIPIDGDNPFAAADDDQQQQQQQPHDEHNNVNPNFRSGTYVVQVPKEQIYRFPTPENALIAERYRKPIDDKNTNNNKKRPRWFSCFLCFCISLVVVVIVLGLTAGLLAIFLKPEVPAFNVDNVVVRNNTHSHYQHSSVQYEITLTARNPNRIFGISYKEGGVATINFRKREIGRGKYPSFFQGGKSTEIFGIVFHGSDIVLPEEIEASMESEIKKKRVTFSLNMNVPARMKIGMFGSGSVRLSIACLVMVDSMAIGTRILSQECPTYRLS